MQPDHLFVLFVLRVSADSLQSMSFCQSTRDAQATVKHIYEVVEQAEDHVVKNFDRQSAMHGLAVWKKQHSTPHQHIDVHRASVAETVRLFFSFLLLLGKRPLTPPALDPRAVVKRIARC